MNRKIPTFALTMALAATPLVACSTSVTDGGVPSANVIPIEIEVFLPGFMRDSSPLILQAYDADGNPLDQIPIEYSQLEANRTTVYAQDRVATVDVIAPINPDGSTYDIEGARGKAIEKDGVTTIKGELTNIHGVATDDDQSEPKDAEASQTDESGTDAE